MLNKMLTEFERFLFDSSTFSSFFFKMFLVFCLPLVVLCGGMFGLDEKATDGGDTSTATTSTTAVTSTIITYEVEGVKWKVVEFSPRPGVYCYTSLSTTGFSCVKE